MRRDCLAAAWAWLCHLAKALGAFLPSHLAMHLSACHAINSSAPAWVARSIANSERSDFGMACTTVTRGFGFGVLSTFSTLAMSSSLPRVSVTVASAKIPSDERSISGGAWTSSTFSPGSKRLTVTAWRPSAPERDTTSPSATPRRFGCKNAGKDKLTPNDGSGRGDGRRSLRHRCHQRSAPSKIPRACREFARVAPWSSYPNP